MPATKVLLFRSDDGSVPLLDWLSELRNRNELRRPTADYLRDGVYELRVPYAGVNYRMLYGFVGQNIVLVSHGLTKEKTVPAKEIELAMRRLALFRSDPDKYSITEWG